MILVHGRARNGRGTIRPSPKDLEELKTPLGRLLTGPPEEAVPKLRRLIQDDKPPMVITVGDVVSKETMKAGLRIDLRIVDNRSMRTNVPTVNFPAKKTFRVKNPAGVITMNAWRTVQRALEERESLVIVEGEEDLLVLPVVLEAPSNSFVVYGQPLEGLVVVKASTSKKREVNTFINRMSREN